MGAVTGLAIAAAAAGASFIGASAFIGRKVTLWRSPKEINVAISSDYKTVTVPADPKTQAVGQYGIWINGSETHLLVGKILDKNVSHAGGEALAREIVRWTGPKLSGQQQGVWTGHVFATPEQLETPYEEVHLQQTPHRVPAWKFSPDSASSEIWGIHIHGLRTSRLSALRSVPVANSLGMTSLVPSFFADADNHANGEACHYGQKEAPDVERAIQFAVQNGAKKIYLFGWSMGATIALQLTETSQHRDKIAGLILISPGPNTRKVISTNAKSAGLPTAIANAVPGILSNKLLSKLSKLERPINFNNLDWTRKSGRLTVPALAIHSEGDTEVPFTLTQAFADSNPKLVKLEKFQPVPHQSEWNSSAKQFEQVVSEWIASVPQNR